MLIGISNNDKKNKNKRASGFGTTLLLIVFLIMGLGFADTFKPTFKYTPIPWMANIIGIVLALILFPIIISLFLYFDFGKRYRKKIFYQYKKQGGGVIHFNHDEYKRAAEVLKNWETIEYKKAIEKYGQRIVDLLLLTFAINLNKGNVYRLVSIKSIEKDMDAADLEEE